MRSKALHEERSRLPWPVLTVSLIAALAAPTPELLASDWERVDSAHWVYRPAFSASEWKTLAKGAVVKRRERLPGADRVVAAIWSSAPKDALWVALQDEGHGQVIEDYVDEDLPGSVFSDRVLYQRIGLPWPFNDRQWVIKVSSNRKLLKLSRDTIWERTWDISPRRGAVAELKSAVWVDVNTGGWALVDAAGGTLAVYHVRASIGGNVPDEAATQWALMTVTGMVSGVDERARMEVETHYVAGHSLIERPDGTMVPPYGTPSTSAQLDTDGFDTPTD